MEINLIKNVHEENIDVTLTTATSTRKKALADDFLDRQGNKT